MGDVLDRKCLPALLFAGIIAPEDRALWLYCMVRACGRSVDGWGGVSYRAVEQSNRIQRGLCG